MEVGVLYLPSVGSLEETLKGFAGKRTDLHQKSARFPINIPFAHLFHLAIAAAGKRDAGGCRSVRTHCLYPDFWLININGQVSLFEQAFKNIDDVLWKEAGCTAGCGEYAGAG